MPATLLSPDGRAARPTLQVTQIRWFWNFRKAAFGSPGKDAPITQPELVGMDGGRSPREGGQRYRFITDTAVEGRAVRPAANRPAGSAPGLGKTPPPVLGGTRWEHGHLRAKGAYHKEERLEPTRVSPFPAGGLKVPLKWTIFPS